MSTGTGTVLLMPLSRRSRLAPRRLPRSTDRPSRRSSESTSNAFACWVWSLGRASALAWLPSNKSLGRLVKNATRQSQCSRARCGGDVLQCVAGPTRGRPASPCPAPMGGIQRGWNDGVRIVITATAEVPTSEGDGGWLPWSTVARPQRFRTGTGFQEAQVSASARGPARPVRGWRRRSRPRWPD
jgi:hypothetical protein